MPKIIFLSEMPITNGVIQAQLLPVLLESARRGYATEVLETTGRFDGQEEQRAETERKLANNNILLKKINVPRFTFLPSILYFSLKTYSTLKSQLKDKESGTTIIYARNYKFIPFLLWAAYFWRIPFIYSPRGAYVAERKYYRKIKDLLYGWIIGFAEKLAIQKSFATIVETEQFKKHLEELYGIDGRSISIIPNYWDASLVPGKNWNREEMRDKLGFIGKKVIVYTGTVEAWYNFEKMVDLVAQLRKKDSTIFFQLFLKEDYARNESLGMFESLPKIFQKYGFKKDNYAVSSYPSPERYFHLSACDAGICLTTTAEFKTMMLYIKIVDFWGAGLPVIANREIGAVAKVIEDSGTGALVDYADWEQSIAKINTAKLFEKSDAYEKELGKYSSEKILPLYFNLFEKIFLSK
jgi:glycosyltransferase involved in cell wall biosynthesis